MEEKLQQDIKEVGLELNLRRITMEEVNISQDKHTFSNTFLYIWLNTFKKSMLFLCKLKQPNFRVAYQTPNFKGKWQEFTGQKCNLREVLKDEIVIEFDMPKDWKGTLKEFQNISWKAINFTAINLYNAGYSFEIWNHEGKSPHLHIHDLPIKHLEKDKLREFKKFFIKKYVPKEYLEYVDFSLCGVHLVALEGVEHWKGCYGKKELINKFNPQEQTQ